TGNDPINRIDPNGLDDIPTQPGETIHITGEAPGAGGSDWTYDLATWYADGWSNLISAYDTFMSEDVDTDHDGIPDTPRALDWVNDFDEQRHGVPSVRFGKRPNFGAKTPLAVGGGSGIRQPKPGVRTPNNGPVLRNVSTKDSSSSEISKDTQTGGKGPVKRVIRPEGGRANPNAVELTHDERVTRKTIAADRAKRVANFQEVHGRDGRKMAGEFQGMSRKQAEQHVLNRVGPGQSLSINTWGDSHIYDPATGTMYKINDQGVGIGSVDGKGPGISFRLLYEFKK
ncbi:hypothetical protein, partial [Streptosporangium sp. OZ121]|uniref:hypothetical protein n=1 Tax=Streptosporangium sp. OZ121 TaxID=3444183 RepID=UPI003F796EFA